jgi:hypothetical protein
MVQQQQQQQQQQHASNSNNNNKPTAAGAAASSRTTTTQKKEPPPFHPASSSSSATTSTTTHDNDDNSMVFVAVADHQADPRHGPTKGTDEQWHESVYDDHADNGWRLSHEALRHELDSLTKAVDAVVELSSSCSDKDNNIGMVQKSFQSIWRYHYDHLLAHQKAEDALYFPFLRRRIRFPDAVRDIFPHFFFWMAMLTCGHCSGKLRAMVLKNIARAMALKKNACHVLCMIFLARHRSTDLFFVLMVSHRSLLLLLLFHFSRCPRLPPSTWRLNEPPRSLTKWSPF